MRSVADQLKLESVAAAQLPQSKQQAVAGLQGQGHCVAMVGDGVNDLPSLAQAQVSFAMGQGTAVAVAQADFVILAGGLASLPMAIRRARRTLGLIRQNLFWAVAYNLAAVPLALTGHLPPWAAGLGMAGSSLLVVINGRRAGASS